MSLELEKFIFWQVGIQYRVTYRLRRNYQLKHLSAQSIHKTILIDSSFFVSRIALCEKQAGNVAIYETQIHLLILKVIYQRVW